jgi:hypothetical protein
MMPTIIRASEGLAKNCHSGAERSEEPGIHSHSHPGVMIAGRETSPLVAMDSGLAGFARAPE